MVLSNKRNLRVPFVVIRSWILLILPDGISASDPDEAIEITEKDK